jgi:hypothetical protein
MSAWVRVVVVVAALKCVSALVAIIALGNTIPAGSLFLPFRLVKVGDNVRYIRIDGEVFDKLS